MGAGDERAGDIVVFGSFCRTMVSNVTAWPRRKEAQMRHAKALYVVLRGVGSMSCAAPWRPRKSGAGGVGLARA